MAGDLDVGIPFFGVIFIVAVILVILQHFTGLDFGALGSISWIIVIVGAGGFILYVGLSISSS